ncbi:MAG: hypothetical protein ACJ768_12785 [Gaiellaceae bacterium]
MADFEAPASVRAIAAGDAGAPAGPTVCMCAHRVYDHGRVNRAGNQVWAGCRICGCTGYRAADGSAWPNTYGGAVLDVDPEELARNTDAWVDGQVLLEHEREPDVGGTP